MIDIDIIIFFVVGKCGYDIMVLLSMFIVVFKVL